MSDGSDHPRAATPESESGQSASWTEVRDSMPAFFARHCRLEVVSGPDEGLKKDFQSTQIRIGSGQGCDFVVTDRTVSRIHVEIRLAEDGFHLDDLGSKNGTYVAGFKIKSIYIPPDTEIEVGRTRIRFKALDQAYEVPLSAESSFHGLLGQSVAMRALFAQVQRIAAQDVTVLVTGETGTGKDVLAMAIHDASPRAEEPFVVVDCAAVSPELIESELFGHEKGAYTGATGARAGAFERANGGTLFLDELGELSPSLQPKFLRVLERREVQRLGSSEVKPVDVRIVAATNRDLVAEVNAGRFREDLFYRIAVMTLRVPPLRERKQDIPGLVEHFLQELPGGPRPVSPELMDQWRQYDWPGNVRELRNAVERFALLGDAGPLRGASGAAASSMQVDTSVPFKIAKQSVIDDFERAYMSGLLEAHGGNIAAVARAAGVERLTVYKILDRLGLREKK